MGFDARGMAFLIIVVFLIGTLIGSVLPETGNFVASKLGMGAHSFNIVFLIIGITCACLALFFGLQSNK